MTKNRCSNPILDFGIDPERLRYIGEGLQRPECILAEPDGVLWVADARGGVVRLAPDGSQRSSRSRSPDISRTPASEAHRYLRGHAAQRPRVRPQRRFPDLELRHRSPRGDAAGWDDAVLADTIDGAAIGKVNFVLRDSKDRIWITVSTRMKNWMHALRTDLADGFLARYDEGAFRIVADGFHFTNEIRFDAREEWLYVVETTGGRITRLRIDERGRRARARDLRPGQPRARARGPTALPSTATAICGARWCTPTSCSC